MLALPLFFECERFISSLLLSISEWCKTWNLNLNKDKCAVIRFSSSAKLIPNSSYILLNSQVKFAQTHCDLGIMVDERLTWSKHYNYISQKAYHSLHLLFRTIDSTASVSLKKHLYLELVRSQFVYCSQLWRPRLIKDIKSIERIQRRATKFILHDYTSEYKSRLISLHILPLMYWLELQDLLFLIKCLKEPSDNFNPLSFISFVNSNTRSATANKLKVNFNRTCHSRHFYFNRIVRLWNSLPVIDLSLSYATLKSTLRQLFWKHFITHFDSNNPCTFHIDCPCFNCVNSSHFVQPISKTPD